MLHGVDVSGHQGVNWQPEPGDTFVFVKATEGSTYFSDDSVAQLRAARAAGLQVGHYHFMVPSNAARQAAWFVDQADIQPGDILVCDWETHVQGHPTVEDAAVFIAEVRRLRPGHRVGLYCNKSDWLGTAVKAGDFLWIARYTTDPDPGITASWAFWQYGTEPIDQNHASSRWATQADLKVWAAQTATLQHSDKYDADYMSFNGGRNDKIIPLDRQIVLACAKAVGWGSVRLVQGGLSTSVTASALTHAGLGVGDISVDDRSKAAVWNYVAALNRSGLRAFPRGFGGDPWGNEQHIHWGSRENYFHAHSQLQAQIREMEAGGDGLRGDGLYNGPHVPLGMWKDSPYNLANIREDTGIWYVTVNTLNGRNVDGQIVRTRTRGYQIQAAQQVFRWGRWNVVTGTPTYYATANLSNDQP